MINWAKIAEIAFAFIASAGGIGAIVVWVVRLGSDSIADRLSKKYQLQLDKEIEKYKTELSKKEYVSKTRFDAAFQMYQTLSKQNLSLVYCAGETILFVRGAPCSDEEIAQLAQRFCDLLNETQLVNRQYAPFIEKHVYDQFLGLENKASELFLLFKGWRQFRDGWSYPLRVCDQKYNDQQEIKQAMEMKQRTLASDSDKLLDSLRDYLGSLDVLDDK